MLGYCSAERKTTASKPPEVKVVPGDSQILNDVEGCSGGQNKPVAESSGDGAAGFEQGFQVGFGSLLKS